MAVDGLPSRINVVVVETKLPTRVPDNGGDDRVVALVHPREQMVGCLVVQSSCEHCPEPTVCCIVLCGCHLHFCPVKASVDFSALVHRNNKHQHHLLSVYVQYYYNASSEARKVLLLLVSHNQIL